MGNLRNEYRENGTSLGNVEPVEPFSTQHVRYILLYVIKQVFGIMSLGDIGGMRHRITEYKMSGKRFHRFHI